MTTHSAILNSEIAVGAPVTNDLMTKLRDNLYAIQEGDASASSYRIQNAALAGLPWGISDLATTIALGDILDSVSISSATATAVLTGMDSTYPLYAVVGWNIQRSSANGSMNMQVRVSGVTQSTRYWSSNGDTNNSALSICDLKTAAGSMAGFQMFIHAPSDTSRQKAIRWDALTIESVASGEGVTKVNAGGAWIPSSASDPIDGVTFSVNSGGTFSLAEFRLVGLRV